MFENIEDLIIHPSDEDAGLATTMQAEGSNEVNAEVEPPSSSPSPGIFLNEGVRKKLKKLIQQYPDGLWCNDLPKAYIKNYNYVLDYKEFGCTSIIHFLSQIPDIIRCERPGDGDWLLFDASLPKSSVKDPHNWSSSGISQPNKEIKYNTLKYKIHHGRGINLGHDIYPSDVVRHEETWVNIDLNVQILKDSLLSIGVGEVWSPHKFFIHLQKFSNFLEKFMSDLQDFYNVQHGKYKMTEAAIRPKQICVGYYSPSVLMMREEWHRAEILTVPSHKSVTVYMVDFGTVATLKRNRLRFLHKGFLGFPAQAIPAKLVGIAPPNNRSTWPATTCATFLELIREPNLKARVVSIDDNFSNKITVLDQPVKCRKPQNRLGIILYKSCSPDSISINKQLVMDNLAVMCGNILSKGDIFPADDVKVENEQEKVEDVNFAPPENLPLKKEEGERNEEHTTTCKVVKESSCNVKKEKREESEEDEKQRDGGGGDDVKEEERQNQTLQDEGKVKEDEVEEQQNQIPRGGGNEEEEEEENQQRVDEEKEEEHEQRYEETRKEKQSQFEKLRIGKNEEEEDNTNTSIFSKASNDYSSDVEEAYDKVQVPRPKSRKIRNKTHSAFSPRWNSSWKNAEGKRMEKNRTMPPGINISTSIPNLSFLCSLILEEEKLQRKKYLLALELLSKNDDLREVALFNPVLALKLSLQMVVCLNQGSSLVPSTESCLSTSDFESELRSMGLDGVLKGNVASEKPDGSHYYPGSFPSSVSAQSICSMSDRGRAETTSSSFSM